MKAETFLIHRPEHQPPIQRTVFNVLTAVAWGVYVYLWLPLVTLLMWLLGVKTAYLEFYLHSHQIDPFLLQVLPQIALATILVMIGWAEYNRLRFRRVDRRRSPGEVSVTEIALSRGTDLETALNLQRARCAVLRMSDQAQLLEVVTVPEPREPSTIAGPGSTTQYPVAMPVAAPIYPN